MNGRTLGCVVIAAGLALSSSAAFARTVMRVGDTVIVDGKVYTMEEWEKIRDNPDAQPAPSSAPQADRQPAGSGAGTAGAPAVRTAQVAGPRAAACKTSRMFDEFPDDNVKFTCSAKLGDLTREEILDRGWKVDLIEKLPAPAGAPSTSSRGLPLNYYKLVISR